MPDRTHRDETVSQPDGGGTTLYRFFDADDRLLYVGITKVLETRWAYHRKYAATTWWALAATKSMQWFAVRQEAVDAELKAIRTEAPLYNSGGAPSPLRELMPGEQLCPHTNTRRFYEATRGGFRPTGRRWRNMDEAVAETIIEDIAEGKLTRGGQFPSGAALVNQFGVSLGTVRRAVRRLVASGALEQRGSGSAVRYFVATE